MPRTREELKRAILAKLNVVGVGEIASAEDIQTVDLHIDTRVAHLVASGVINGFDFSAIPETMFEDVATHVASAAAPDFGQPSSADAEARAEANLRRLLRPTASTPVKPDYF